jgi:hypothetical protein
MAKTPVMTEEMKLMFEKFRSKMASEGYTLLTVKDKWLPEIIADKKGHYRISAIGYLDSNTFTVRGSIGTNVSNVFRYKIEKPADNTEERFNMLMWAADPYIRKVLKSECDEQDF